jgi:hypothetical protein
MFCSVVYIFENIKLITDIPVTDIPVLPTFFQYFHLLQSCGCRDVGCKYRPQTNAVVALMLPCNIHLLYFQSHIVYLFACLFIFTLQPFNTFSFKKT